jgi:ADP-heptose:LPS heptosyltransferase
MTEAGQKRILIIKHGALGDFVLATGPFQALRAHHADDHITLLTTPFFEDMARDSGYFDDVWLDSRPKIWQPGALWEFRHRLNQSGFARIYDLQTSSRSSLYYKLLKQPRPEWSGIAEGCALPHDNAFRDEMHTLDRQAEQLAVCGIDQIPPPNLDWLQGDSGRFEMPARYALLVPGGSAHRPGKRWPATAYRELCRHMIDKCGLTPVLIGSKDEMSVCKEIAFDLPLVRDLCGRTTLGDVVSLARGAELTIGNDTGPMHMIAVTGCKTVVLFSTDSDPDLCAPRGDNVSVLSAMMTAGIAFLDVVDTAGLNDGEGGIVARVYKV